MVAEGVQSLAIKYHALGVQEVQAERMRTTKIQLLVLLPLLTLRISITLQFTGSSGLTLLHGMFLLSKIAAVVFGTFEPFLIHEHR